MAYSKYQRETDEYVPVAVTVNGVLTTSGISFSVVPNGERPTAWTPGIIRGTETGFRISALAAGFYHVYARATDTPYAPVIDCGVIEVE